MASICLLLSGVYTALILLLLRSWKNLESCNGTASLQDTFITVIIPVRNEAENIIGLLEDINLQTYPQDMYEVIVVDDGSEDNTAALVKQFNARHLLKLITTDGKNGTSHKKDAVTKGILNAKGKLIIATDGDCRVGPSWISSIENFYKNRNSKFIFGGVTFAEEKNLFEKMQTIEFASLTGCGAAFLNIGYPNMCNGANIAYEKEVFFEVSGYQGFEDHPSGDDEFLMHKVYQQYPDRVHFLKNRDAIVYTRAQNKWKDFLNQRKRWAGKWKYYVFPSIKVIAVFIFVCNFSLLVSLAMFVRGTFPFQLLAIQWILKMAVDYFFIREILRFYRKNANYFIFMLTAIFYPFYASFFAITSNIGGYRWKNRSW
jgi:cellulose synthase/poly-beta-1,6-N-acetylglucosamine synthase-like glycosyltransferase